jgi:putative ABC transport system permease protein
MAGFWTRWRGRRSNPQQPSTVDAELDFHVDMQIRRYLDAGLTPEAARERALQRLGDLDRARQACDAITFNMETDMHKAAWWQDLRQDISYAWRVLRRSPMFTATALATLAIGIGANTAIFSVVNAVLLRTVPYPDADRVVMIWNSYGQIGLSRAAVAAAEFADYREQQHSFVDVAAMRNQSSTLAGDCSGGGSCEPERVFAYVISPQLFSLLNTKPAMGRPFTEADGRMGAEKVILLSDALWRRRFQADPAIVGRTVLVGAIPRLVVGVMPEGIRFPDAPLNFLKDPADLWIPYGWEQSRTDGRGNQNLGVIARMKPGVRLADAQRDLDRIADGFRAQFPDRYAGAERGWHIVAVTMRDQMVGDVRPALWLLVGAVGLVLLTACANVANLLLARGTARRREIAVRSALGASRARLVRQLFIEAFVLVTGGGLLGIALAVAGVRILVRLDPGTIPRLETARLEPLVLAFAAVLTMCTALLVGLAPAIRQSRADPQSSLGEGSRGGATTPARRRLRSLLVVGEVAIAVVLLVGAGLLGRSLLAMTRIEPGFDPSGIAVAEVTLPGARYDTAARIDAFHVAFTEKLAALPGVAQSSAVYPLPMSGSGWSGSVEIETQPSLPGGPPPHAEYAVALPNYFKALQIPLHEGRDFDMRDVPGAEPVAIIDEELARRHWPGESAVGKRIGPFGKPSNNKWTTVIGVVGHVRNAGPKKEGEPQVYLSGLQQAESLLYYVARTPADVGLLPPMMREALRAIDPSLPVTKLTTMPEAMAKVMAPQRFNALMLGVFGAVALTLAAIGLYGVIALLVTQQTREIGIRLALGGRPSHVLSRILREGLVMTAAGIVIGLASAVLLSRAVSGLLFEVRPTDPLTYASIAVLFLGVAAVASYAPARRAMRVDPVEVLRA